MKTHFIVTLCFATPLLGSPLKQLVDRADDRSWQDIPCDYKDLDSAIFSDPEKNWNDAKASIAWMEMQMAYGKNKSKKSENADRMGIISFTDFLADYFHTNPALDCGNPESVTCDATFVCGQGTAENAGVSSPAGYLILNSLVSLHRHYRALYLGLKEAQGDLNGEIDTFVSIFSPQYSQLKEHKIAMDILTMGLGAVTAGMFNGPLKTAPFFNTNEGTKNLLGGIKDMTNTLLNQGINIYKDSLSAVDELAARDNLKLFMTETIVAWRKMTEAALKRLMNGEGEQDINGDGVPDLDGRTSTELHNAITNGQVWLKLFTPPSPSEVTQTIKRALFGILLPRAWQLAGKEIGTFIAIPEGLEGKEGDCESYDPAKKYELIYDIPDGIMVKNRFCDNKGNPAWLLSVRRANRNFGDCNLPAAPGINACDTPKIEQLPGWDKVDGESWGGLKRSDLVTSAIRAWKKNGKKNGWSALNLETKEGRDELAENGLGAMGVVNIPVCSFSEAFSNAYPDKKTDNWPCN